MFSYIKLSPWASSCEVHEIHLYDFGYNIGFQQWVGVAFSNKKSNVFFSTIKCFGKVEVGGAKKTALISEKDALTGPCLEDSKPHVKCHYSSLEVKVIISLRY